MEISIIILSYNMKRLVRNCIRTIRESAITVPYEIIVVDNASGDAIGDMMKEEFPDIRFLMNDRNVGMGGGNNIGIRAAQGAYVLIMNPDIYVARDSIQKMYEYIKTQSDIGVVSPRLLNPDKSLQYTCYRWHKPLTPLLRRTAFGNMAIARRHIDEFLMKDFDHACTRDVDWVQGSCFMVPKGVFDKVGLFDESFFMYFEDTDLCRRMWQSGYRVVYFTDTDVVHMHMRMSSGGIIKILTNRLTREHIKSWIRYSWKHRRRA